ncbi:MAG: M23 family metallopeptidase [Treponema sp.]|jgi:murein DD-endopeptidase MepM/ murein hydrolase activator NlpD|nr:M23 family metallopeptidase [Treponema sp.]
MIESTMVQHVERRKSLSRQGRSYASPNFIDQIRQAPAHKRHPLRLKNAARRRPAPLERETEDFQPFSLKKTLEELRRRPGRPENPGNVRPFKVPGALPQAPKPRPAPPRPVSLKRISPKMILLPAAALAILFLLRGGVSFYDYFPLGIDAISAAADSGLSLEMASYAGLMNGPDAQSAALSAAQSEDIPLDLVESFAWISYTVKKGETVSQIASDHGLSWDAVIAANGLTNVRSLREGQILRLPNMDGIPYEVKRGDSLEKIATAMAVPLEVILDANEIESDSLAAGITLFIPGARMKTDELKLALGELFIYPLSSYRLSSSFGWRTDPISGAWRNHTGIDLAAPTGTTVKAAQSGTVSSTGYNATYGNFIIMSHSGQYQTMYAHLSKISVKQGAYVYQGAKIGEVGSTGYSTGPHLHFSVYKNSKAVNPLDYLSK